MSGENENNIIKIIQNGDIEGFKSACICNSDINRPLSINKNIKIISKSKKCPFKTIESPTIVVLTILCEQDSLLNFILNEFKPDLSVRVNGWLPLHFACCTGSHKCLQTLLQYEYIQENIDSEVDVQNVLIHDPSRRTTALHIAVSNRCHAQAIILCSDLPQIIYGSDGKKLETAKDSEYQSVNINQLSVHGNTPLHIAAKINDIDMTKILCVFGAETNVENQEGKTPFAIASSTGHDTVCKIIEEQDESEDELRNKYLHEENEAEKKKEEEGKEEKVEYANKEEINELTDRVSTLIALVRQLNARLQTLEGQAVN